MTPGELEADKIACFIRYRCVRLQGKERQIRAKQLLAQYPVEQQEQIRAALIRRAGK